MIFLGAQDVKISNDANAQAVIQESRSFEPDDAFEDEVCDWMIVGSNVTMSLRYARYNGNPVNR